MIGERFKEEVDKVKLSAGAGGMVDGGGYV
jgi:hypothetical protein